MGNATSYRTQQLPNLRNRIGSICLQKKRRIIQSHPHKARIPPNALTRNPDSRLPCYLESTPKFFALVLQFFALIICLSSSVLEILGFLASPLETLWRSHTLSIAIQNNTASQPDKRASQQFQMLTETHREVLLEGFIRKYQKSFYCKVSIGKVSLLEMPPLETLQCSCYRNRFGALVRQTSEWHKIIEQSLAVFFG